MTGDARETTRAGRRAMLREQLLARARSGDDEAFSELVDPYRRELHLHCYRILGSLQDAEDLLQETMLAAWRGLDRFEQRSSVRAWLYRIATNRCLNARRARARRPQEEQPMLKPPEPTRRVEPLWLEPYPDVLREQVADMSPGPDARYEMREAVGLAFVAALQHLPPRQRAVLVLREVLGFSAAEVADMLDTSEAAAKGALQRARATLESQLATGKRESSPLPGSVDERALAGRFADAFECGDVDGVVSLLTDDAWLSMPPEPFEYQGPAAIARFLHYRVSALGVNVRLVAARANGQPAFGCYLPDALTGNARFYGLLVLTARGDGISAITWFGDRSLFSRFELPRTLRD